MPASPLSGMLARILNMLKWYSLTLASRQFGMPDIAGQPADNIILALPLIVTAVVGGWFLARRWPALVMYLVLSAGVLLVFPWTVGRLLTAILPWFIVALLFGATNLAVALGSRHGERVGAFVGVMLAGFGLASGVPLALRERSCRAVAPYFDSRCYDPDARH